MNATSDATKTTNTEVAAGGAGSSQMKAITRHVYGQADALSYEEIDRPTVGADEVMVRIEAAGVDRGVWHLITGLPYPVRLAGYGVRAPKNPVIGMDLAGAVEAVGRNVTTFAPGDRVYGNADGSFAEYATTSADRLARMPANLSFEQAAVVPVSAVAALQGLRKGNVEAGQRLLIIGASGGVGTYAVQIAKAWGAEVTGVCSTSKVHHVKAIGADHVIDYTQQDIASRAEQYDVIIDIGGNRTLTELRRALTPEGTLVIAGGETDGRWLGGTDRQIRAMLLSLFVSQKLGTFICAVNAEDLSVITNLIESGTVNPVVDQIYPLSHAPTAIADLLAGQVRGKLAISVGDHESHSRN